MSRLIESLCWPENWPRTAHPIQSTFAGDRTVTEAAKALVAELSARSGVHRLPFAHSIKVTVSDGTTSPRVNVDQGAAVWFTRSDMLKVVVENGKITAAEPVRYCLACDKWDRASDNVWALKLHVQALRGLERWGVGEADRALAGYRTLPPSPDARPHTPPPPRKRTPAAPHWAHNLGIAEIFGTQGLDEDAVEAAHRALVLKHHPDRGGDVQTMALINAARDEALAWLTQR